MPEPTSGFPIHRLTNSVEISFWWEDESEGVWFIYRNPGEFDWRGGGIHIQMGADYLANKGPEYLDLCLKQINDRIKTLWPSLFTSTPPPPATGFPPSLVAAGTKTVELSTQLANADLVNNQLQK